MLESSGTIPVHSDTSGSRACTIESTNFHRDTDMPDWFTLQGNDWVSLVIVGVIAAFFLGYIMQGRGFGWLGNLLLGVLGAIIGPIIYGLIMRVTPSQYDFINRLPTIDLGHVVQAMIGAFILLVLANIIRKRQSKSK